MVETIILLEPSEAKDFKSDVKWIAISIVDPGMIYPKLDKENCLGVHRTSFLNVVEPSDNVSLSGIYSETHAKDIIGFINLFWNKASKLIITCDSTKSRSASVGASIDYIMNESDPKEYFYQYEINNLVYSKTIKVAKYGEGKIFKLNNKDAISRENSIIK